MLRIGSPTRLTRFPNEVGGLDRRQRATLDVGSWLILAALGLGLQMGSWPVWSARLATAGYAIWVLSYSEATVQITRRRLAESEAPPPEEHGSPDSGRNHRPQKRQQQRAAAA